MSSPCGSLSPYWLAPPVATTGHASSSTQQYGLAPPRPLTAAQRLQQQGRHTLACMGVPARGNARVLVPARAWGACRVARGGYSLGSVVAGGGGTPPRKYIADVPCNCAGCASWVWLAHWVFFSGRLYPLWQSRSSYAGYVVPVTTRASLTCWGVLPRTCVLRRLLRLLRLRVFRVG